MMKPTRAAGAKRLAQLTALDTGLESFAFFCAIHGPEALSSTQHGWCIECRQMSIEARAAKDQRKTEYRADYRAENLGSIRAAQAAHSYAHRATHRLANGHKTRPLPASYETEREAIERFYAGCPEGNHVDHCIPVNGKLVSGLHCIANFQYLPGVINEWKGSRFQEVARCNRPANALPGGAMDPERTEHDKKVDEMLALVQAVCEEYDRKQAQAAKREAKRGERSAQHHAA